MSLSGNGHAVLGLRRRKWQFDRAASIVFDARCSSLLQLVEGSPIGVDLSVGAVERSMKQGSYGWLTRRTDRIVLGRLLDVSVSRCGDAARLLSNRLKGCVGQRQKPRTSSGVDPLEGTFLG